MARRLVERGVRFVQIYSGGGNFGESWDAHWDLKENHELHCAETDKPIAGMLTDLKSRGMLDSTLIIWHGEFGRMPISQKMTGRDHNPYGFSIWLAGGGIKGGTVVGAHRRVRLRGRRGQEVHQRPPRDDAAPAGTEPREADVLPQRPPHAPDGRFGQSDKRDHRVENKIWRSAYNGPPFLRLRKYND